MANIIAILILGLQYALAALIVCRFLGYPTLSPIPIFIFPVFVCLAAPYWYEKRTWEPAEWRKRAVQSLTAGIGFFGVDWVLALSHGQSNPFRFGGGLLGVPLTLCVWVYAMICVSGLAKALYTDRNVRRSQ